MYNVNLDVFQGPLDLLLHLIEKMEIDIYNIPIAKLTESYLNYINNNDEQDIVEDDLVQQLIEYKNYKELSQKLAALHHSRAQYLEKESIDIETEVDLRNLNISSNKLLHAMENILKTFDNNNDQSIISYKREISLEKIKEDLLFKFENNKKILFNELIDSYTEKYELVLVFISILTMIKDQQIFCSNNKDELSLEYIVEEK